MIPDKNTLSIPIGKARNNMELFILTEDGRLTKEKGAKGELLVRGTSVSYGYLGDDEKTKKAFIQNPNNSFFYDPLYCTGDLVQIDDNGNFIYSGRVDDQIKYLGYRIELGEIEASLATIEQIEEGVVVFGKSKSDDENEIGALVSLGSPVDMARLRELLIERLPGYMVPTKIKIFDAEFPRTPNGKYDRKLIAKIVFEEN
jgi:acyl-coenzyme A synthetase/AMP-(fatty) acid ligase